MVLLQVLIKNRDGDTLLALNLDLMPDRFSLNDMTGKLLEYGIEGSKINLLTKIVSDKTYDYNENHNHNVR